MPATLRKLDLKKELKNLYAAAADRIQELTVPDAHFLMVDGHGDPNSSPEYSEAVETLFSVSYPLKFEVRKRNAVDYSVMPLESLWWTTVGKPFSTKDKRDWCWTAMILQPEFVTKELMDRVIDDVKRKKKLAALSKLRLESFTEGRAIQVLHLGPYSEEHGTIQRLHDHAHQHGYTLTGKHHEIYLNTPQRTAADKLRTILRQPIH
jgi:hypothetical protein